MPNTLETTSNLCRQVAEVIGAFNAEVMRRSTGEMLQLMQREGLSMPRLATVMFLDRHGQQTISEISEYLNLTLGTTSHIVDQLVEGGYVERHECREDRRQKQVSLSERGRTFMNEIQQARIVDLSRQLQRLPDPLLERMHEIMREAIAQLDTTT
jgi:DNA-binding MarR family transcriptional regulator